MTAYLKDKNISTDDEDDDAFAPSRRLRKIREDVALAQSQLDLAEQEHGEKQQESVEDSDSDGAGSTSA